jgi:hypothetical protein
MQTNIDMGARIKSESIEATNSRRASFVELTEYNKAVVLAGGASNNHKWALGGCPRCRGDIFLDSEDGELLGHCLQCGYVGIGVVAIKSRPTTTV